MSARPLPDPVWWPVEPEPGESLLGFAARTMEDNVLPHLQSVFADTGHRYRQRYADVVHGEADPEAIATVLAAPLEEIVGRRGGRDADGQFRFRGVAMRSDDVCTRQLRFSPRSLAASPHHRGDWMIRHLPFDAVSWETLVFRCRCGAAQNWVAVREFGVCPRCETALSSTDAEPIPTEWQESLTTYAALLSGDPETMIQASARFPAELAALEPGHLADLAVAITPVVEPRIKGSPRSPVVWRDRPLLLSSALARAVEVMLEWPSGLFENLAGLCDISTVGARAPELQRIGRLLLPRARAVLPQPVADLIEAVAESLRSPGGGDERSISFREAEKQARHTLNTLHRERRAGRLKTTFVLRRGELVPALDRAEIDMLAGISSINPSTFGRRVGLPGYAVEQLVGAGLLDRIDHSFVEAVHGVRIPECQLSDFLDRLRVAACALPKDCTIALSTLARSIGGREKPYAAIFKALLERSAPFAFDGDAGSGVLTRIRLRADDLSVFRGMVNAAPRHDASRHDGYSQEDAIDVLNLHYNMVSAIWELGYRRIRTARVFDRDVILDAARVQVTSGEMASLVNLPAKTIEGILRRGGIRRLGRLGFPREAAIGACLASAAGLRLHKR